MALEGGYDKVSIANSVQACMEVLLKQKPIIGSSEAYPFESSWRVIRAVRIFCPSPLCFSLFPLFFLLHSHKVYNWLNLCL